MSEAALREVAGFPTYVTRMGDGKRRALFLHCTLGSTGSWTRVQAALLPCLDMTAFDRPGHGRSGPWERIDDGAGLHRLTTDIAAALIDGPMDVIGHSFGATVALRLAMEHPDKVKRVVLIEPVALAAIAGTPMFQTQVTAMGQMRALFDAGDRAGAARAFHESVSPELPWDRLSEGARTRFTEQIHVVAAEGPVTLDDSPGLLVPGRLEALTQPVLLMEGSRSPQVFRDVQGALAERLPQVERVVVDGAGHMSPLTHADEVAAAIAQFLQL